jgi:hypothetical protein
VSRSTSYRHRSRPEISKRVAGARIRSDIGERGEGRYHRRVRAVRHDIVDMYRYRVYSFDFGLRTSMQDCFYSTQSQATVGNGLHRHSAAICHQHRLLESLCTHRPTCYRRNQTWRGMIPSGPDLRKMPIFTAIARRADRVGGMAAMDVAVIGAVADVVPDSRPVEYSYRYEVLSVRYLRTRCSTDQS